MKIREYITNKNTTTDSDTLLELYEQLKEYKSVPDLTNLNSIDKDLDELFFKVNDKANILNRLINRSISLVLEDIDEIDCGFLNRKIPPHIKSKL
jgi:hypothetical protein